MDPLKLLGKAHAKSPQMDFGKTNAEFHPPIPPAQAEPSASLHPLTSLSPTA
jgi:hypothetical protein